MTFLLLADTWIRFLYGLMENNGAFTIFITNDINHDQKGIEYDGDCLFLKRALGTFGLV